MTILNAAYYLFLCVRMFIFYIISNLFVCMCLCNGMYLCDMCMLYLFLLIYSATVSGDEGGASVAAAVPAPAPDPAATAATSTPADAASGHIHGAELVCIPHALPHALPPSPPHPFPCSPYYR